MRFMVCLLFQVQLVIVEMDNLRPGRTFRWKLETVGREGRGVVCGKPAPPRL
jgi:hypothetical protein